MSIEVLMPQSGMGISEATLSRWLKAEGDSISEGEVIAEIETAKAIEELESPITGVLKKIILPEGDTADVQTVIALLDDGQ